MECEWKFPHTGLITSSPVWIEFRTLAHVARLGTDFWKLLVGHWGSQRFSKAVTPAVLSTSWYCSLTSDALRNTGLVSNERFYWCKRAELIPSAMRPQKSISCWWTKLHRAVGIRNSELNASVSCPSPAKLTNFGCHFEIHEMNMIRHLFVPKRNLRETRFFGNLSLLLTKKPH